MPALVLTFLVVLSIVLGVYWLLVVRPERRGQQALKRRLHRADSLKTVGAHLRKEATRLSQVPALNALLERRARLVAPLQRSIDQAGLTVTVGTILLASGCLFFGGLLLVRATSGLAAIGVVAGLLLAYAPFAWVSYRRQKRMNQFEETFPEAIDLITRALRAGHAFTTGLAMVAEEMPKPVSEEFRLLYDRQNYGLPLPEALRAFAERIPIIDARFFVTAVLTQREAGGNLSEVLENLASVIRDRFKVKREIRVKSAHARITGWILAALPPSLALGFFIVTPQHMRTLITDPIGVRLILAALVLQTIGTLIIRKLVRIEY